MPVELENVQITSYQIGVLDADADQFTFVSMPAPGDGDADGRDFLTWQRSYGSVEPAADDGDVDGRDFLIWQKSSVEPSDETVDLLGSMPASDGLLS